MNTDFGTAAWSRHHRDLTTTIHKLFKEIAVGLAALNRRQFDAPWRHA